MRLPIVLLLFLCTCAVNNLLASDVYVFETDGYIPVEQILVLPDEGDSLSLTEVRTSKAWTPASNYHSFFGLRQKTAWVKLQLSNQSPAQKLLLEYQVPFTKYIAYYNEEGTVEVTGTDKMHQRSYRSAYFLFDMDLAPGEERTVFFKIQSGHQLIFPFRVLSPSYLQSHRFWLRHVLYGIFVGIMLLTILYNLIIFISTRHRIYILYIAYLVFVSLTQFSLLGLYQNYFPFLGPSNNYLVYYFYVAAIGPFGLLFFYRFLNIRKYYPKLVYLLYFLLISYISAFVLVLFECHLLSYLFFQVNAVISCPFAIGLSAYMGFVKKQRPARLFMIGWFPVLLGNMTFVMMCFGILAPIEWNWSIMSFGTVFQAILLLAALSDLINELNKDKQQSELQRFQISKDNDSLRLGLKEAQLNVLQRQMNPHFIFNALHSIQNHLDKYADSKVGTLLDEFSGLMRTSLIHSRQENVLLAEELRFLETYLKVEQTRFRKGFDYHIEVAEDIAPHEVSINPLLIQPLCENAIKHGFALSSQRGLLELSFSKISDSSIRCLIKDNGVGIKQASTTNNKRLKRGSLGLDLIRQRMGLLVEQGYEASFKIIPSDTATVGTVVELILPDYETH